MAMNFKGSFYVALIRRLPSMTLVALFPHLYERLSAPYVRRNPKSSWSRLARYARGRTIQQKEIATGQNAIAKTTDGDVEISVVIANYNYGAHLQKAIESIQKSAKAIDGVFAIELVVVDDGSSDGSPEIIRSLLSGLSFEARWIFLEKNVGQSKARNLGIKATRGKFVFFLDSDNWIRPQCLQTLRKIICEKGACAAFGRIEVVGDHPKAGMFLSSEPFELDAMRVRNYIDLMALFRRDTLVEVGGFPEWLMLFNWSYEDWYLWLKVGRQNQVASTDEVVADYLMKGDSLIHDAQLDGERYFVTRLFRLLRI